MVRSFADRGYAVWNVGYPVFGAGRRRLADTFEDAATAVDLLDEVAGRWPIDPEAVLTVGVSAGEHLRHLVCRPARPARGLARVVAGDVPKGT